MALSDIKKTSGIQKYRQDVFGGINHTAGSRDGEIWDMGNMTGDHYPVLATRDFRYMIRPTGVDVSGGGIFYYRGLFVVEGDQFHNTLYRYYWSNGGYVAETISSAISSLPVYFAAIGDYVVIFPDAMYVKVTSVYSAHAESGYLYEEWAGTAALSQVVTNLELTFTSGIRFNIDSSYFVNSAAWSTTVTSTSPATSEFLELVGGNTYDISTDIEYGANVPLYVAFFRDTNRVYYYGSKTLTTETSFTVPSEAPYVVFTWKGDADTQSIILTTKTTDYITGTGFDFNVGDAVKITTASDKTAYGVIIEASSTRLDFQFNTFASLLTDLVDGGSISITNIDREVPELDNVMTFENRLWGYSLGTIYASKLGDPFNWYYNNQDGYDSWAYPVDEDGNIGESEGYFTGCTSYLGYPMFFKENEVYKITGDSYDTYGVSKTYSLGVDDGSAKSIALAGEKMYYLSHGGIVQYEYSPQIISRPLGREVYHTGAAGSDGRKYYVSVYGKDTGISLFVYDPEIGTWHRESGSKIESFTYGDGTLFAQYGNGGVFSVSSIRTGIHAPERYGTVENAFDSYATFSAWDGDTDGRKDISKIGIECELESGAALTVKIKFEGDSTYTTVATIDDDGVATIATNSVEIDPGNTGNTSASERGGIVQTTKKYHYLPIIPRRADWFSIKLEGTGSWKVWSITREYKTGSEVKG